jgi:CRISPR type III-A-associated RAMP protein Csm4
MNPGLVVKLRPSGPWRIGPDSGARNRVDVIYHSDSLYSAVTSAMSRMGRLTGWLDATARSATPEVCFSSCFPFIEEVGFVVPPRTMWPPLSQSLMAAHVRWKSARFIPLTMVQSILAGERLDEDRWSVDGPSGCLLPSGKQGPFRTSVRWGAAVDRLSGASERHSTACIEFRPGAGLWTVIGFASDAARDQWQESIKAAFRWLADTGFGGERSRGWGRSEAPEFIEGELPGMIIGEVPAPEVEFAEAQVLAPPVMETLNGASPPVEPVPEPPAESAAEAQVLAPPVIEPMDDVAGAMDDQSAPPMQESPDKPSPVPLAESKAEAVAAEPAGPEVAEAQVLAPPVILPMDDVAGTNGEQSPVPPMQEPPDEPSPAPPVEPPAEEPPVEEPMPEPGRSEPPPDEPLPEVQEPGPPAPEPVPDSSASPAQPVRLAAEMRGGVALAEGSTAAAVAIAPEPEVIEAPAIPEAEPLPLPIRERRSGQSHWILSLFSPAAGDTVDWARGSYTLMARGGRVDSPAGSGELKKQIQMIAEGSVLVAETAPLGMAPDVAPDGFAHPVFRAGFALAIPLPEVH